ncbi:MAG: BON domain-containing protein [Methyloceanibacter sp.]
MSERPSARLSSESILVRSDSDIKRDVEDELKWDPEIMDPTDIAVSVKDGVVTLAGFARRYIDKWEAEWAAKRVQGVVGIANDIEVRLPDADERPDPEIARDAVASIKLQLPEAWENITVIVRDAWVTLQGHVEWQYQREAAERAVHPIKGVKSISNLIRIEPKVAPSEVKRKIEEAFKRSAELDARRITIEVVGNEVILRGTVRSWSEYAEAERAAWAAPGVVNVTNELVVEA